MPGLQWPICGPMNNPTPNTMAPTLHTFTRWLSPWRTIFKLCAINRRLQRSNDQLTAMVFLACSKNVPRDRRLRRCPTHGQQPPNAWGCPECVRELRNENQQLHRRANTLADLRFCLVDDVRYLENQLATAREALQRVERYAGFPEVLLDLIRWIQSGMTGPLPPLPERLAKREQADAGEGL